MPYSALDQKRILTTIEQLHERIEERFPDASLTQVASELVDVGRRHAAQSEAALRPNWGLRAISGLMLALGLGALVLLLKSVKHFEPSKNLPDVLQSLESGLSMIFLLAASVVLLTSLELRRKRNRVIAALHQLRALAHVVDMHQLTKDPDHALHKQQLGDTRSSPRRSLNRHELTRYLDYCTEMLALMGKLAALYAQSFPDPAAVAAVDAIEDLTTGLSRKIWQKIMILANHSQAVAANEANQKLS